MQAATMTRFTFRLKQETLDGLKAVEDGKPREEKRRPGERVRLLIEDYVEQAKPRRKARA